MGPNHCLYWAYKLPVQHQLGLLQPRLESAEQGEFAALVNTTVSRETQKKAKFYESPNKSGICILRDLNK